MSDKYMEIDKSVVMLYPENNTNMSCIELDDGLYFVDASYSADTAKKFREDMEKKYGKKAKALLLTHYHQDHYCGMSAFKDVEIIAPKENFEEYKNALSGSLSKENRKLRVENHKKLLKERNIEVTPRIEIFWENFPKAELILPTKTVEEKMVIGDGEKKIKYKVTGGHSTCSSIIYVPFAKTLIIGDNLASDPASVGGCFFAGISDKTINVLESVEKLDVETVIPGHGPKTDLKYLITARKYFAKLFKLFEEMIIEGKTVEEAVKDKRVPEFYDKQPGQWEVILKRQFDRVTQEYNKKLIKKTFTSYLEANKKNIADEILTFYTKNFSILFPGGQSITGEETFRYRHLKEAKIIKDIYEPQDSYFLGEKYVEKGKHYHGYELNGTKVKQERDYMLVWEKEEGKWKIGLDIVLSEKTL